jgi:hypothetical protein
MKKTFLGGTCNESTWRDIVIKQLDHDYFNPVVEDWTPECQKEELEERQNANCCLYCITPKMTGVYSVAEVIDDSNKRPEKTVLVLLRNDEEETLSIGQWKSLLAVGELVLNNGGKVFYNLDDACHYINSLDTQQQSIESFKKKLRKFINELENI